MSPDGTITVTGADGSTEVIQPPEMPVPAEFGANGEVTNLSELEPGTYTTQLPDGGTVEVRVSADFDDPDVAGGYTQEIKDANGKILGVRSETPTNTDFGGGASEVGEVPAEDPNAPQEVGPIPPEEQTQKHDLR